MYIIVGLGNPTKEYNNTRHNIGFDVIDKLADMYSISVLEKKHKVNNKPNAQINNNIQNGKEDITNTNDILEDVKIDNDNKEHDDVNINNDNDKAHKININYEKGKSNKPFEIQKF